MKRCALLVALLLVILLATAADATDPATDCRYRTDPAGQVTIARWTGLRTDPNSLSVWLTGSCQKPTGLFLVELRLGPADVQQLHDMLGDLIIEPYPEG